MKWHALVRPPGRSFANAISSTGAAIDVDLALRQHDLYCQALREAGVDVEPLPADERFPDSCFMQDPCLVIAGKAIIARPGASSRRGEEQLVAPTLEKRFPTFRIAAPGTLEGGDVLVLPGRVYVGLSDRSNPAGIEQLRAVLAPLPVAALPVQGLLHLLSGITYLGGDTLLAVEAFVDRPELRGMRVLCVPQDEAYACNALGLGDAVIVPAGYERTAAMLSDHGFRVLAVPVSEYTKADGGVTCLSLIYPEGT
jgi:dimethylargininase